MSSDKEVAEYFGISSTSVHNWKRRGSIPYDECVELAIAKKAGLEWLLFGEGVATGTAVASSRAIGHAEVRVPARAYDASYSAIPIYDIEAAAGTGRLFDDELVETTIQFDTEQLQRDGLDPSQLVGVRVRGDSMGETLHDGDRVLVDRSSRTPDGVFLLRMDDGLRIKRVQRVAGGGWMLISDNGRYQSELVDPLSNQNVEIIGECVMRLGRIS
ncbi:helix-turn-helix domain-containing protein [Larsenimonas sp. GH3-8]|nr:helix-turn-helix domain-containing protein [Larsenimonas rhizosphaerae]